MLSDWHAARKHGIVGHHRTALTTRGSNIAAGQAPSVLVIDPLVQLKSGGRSPFHDRQRQSRHTLRPDIVPAAVVGRVGSHCGSQPHAPTSGRL